MRLGERRKLQPFSHLYSRTLAVNGFRLAWIVLIIGGELGVFYWSLSACKWPVLSSNEKSTRVLLVSDPQVQHPLEADGPTSFNGRLRRFIFDMNIRKSWDVTSRMKPHVVIFLGDMLASGRNVKDEPEYERHAAKFKSIFALHPSVSVYHIPGNSDVGMGVSPSFYGAIRSHYTALFGPFNQEIVIHNHTFLLIDAPGLVDEDYQRAGRGVGFDEWSALPGGTTAFVKSVKRGKSNFIASVYIRSPPSYIDEKPLILLSHIPLARPDSASCGSLREQGTIRRGVSRGYQNTLGKQTTAFLLQTLQPSAVFSGDNRDYCEYVHTPKRSNALAEHAGVNVREITVKSFSMAKHIRHPGFQLLSLINPTTDPNQKSFDDVPCSLPDQYGIYSRLYLPFFLLTMFALAILSTLRRRRGRAPQIEPLDLSRHSSGTNTPNDAPDSAIWSPYTPVASVSPRSVLPPSIRTPTTLAGPTLRASRPATPLGSPLLTPIYYPHEDDDDEGMFPTQYATRQDRARALENEEWSPGHNRGSSQPLIPHFTSAPGLKPAVHRRGWSYSWTFVFRGRRRRMTMSVPTFSKGLLSDLGELFMGSEHIPSRNRILRTTLHDAFSIFWLVTLVWVLLNWQWIF